MDFLNYIYILPEQMFLGLTQVMVSIEKLDGVFSCWSMFNSSRAHMPCGEWETYIWTIDATTVFKYKWTKKQKKKKKLPWKRNSVCMWCIIIGEFICEAGIYELF